MKSKAEWKRLLLQIQHTLQPDAIQIGLTSLNGSVRYNCCTYTIDFAPILFSFPSTGLFFISHTMQHAINWASSDKPLDTLIAPAAGDAGKLSAGRW